MRYWNRIRFFDAVGYNPKNKKYEKLSTADTLPFYLKIKGILESIVFGPGIFWLLLIWMTIARKRSKHKEINLTHKIGLSGLILITAITAPSVTRNSIFTYLFINAPKLII